MKKKSAATIQRHPKSGAFVVRKEGGETSAHKPGKNTPAAVSASLARNREALRRLANR